MGTGDQSRDAGLLRLETKRWQNGSSSFSFTQVNFNAPLNETYTFPLTTWSSGQQVTAVQSCWKLWPTAMFPSVCFSPLSSVFPDCPWFSTFFLPAPAFPWLQSPYNPASDAKISPLKHLMEVPLDNPFTCRPIAILQSQPDCSLGLT